MCVELCDSVVSVGQHKRGSNDVKRGLHDDGLHIGQQQHHPKQQEINVISNGLKKENKQEQVYYNNKTKVESITGHQQRGAGSVRKCNKNVTNPMLPASEKKKKEKELKKTVYSFIILHYIFLSLFFSAIVAV
jgi:hypothetical protein